MSVRLQDGLYELCRLRIEKDKEFQAAAQHRNFDAVDDALFDEYRLFQLKRTLKLVSEESAFYRRLYANSGIRVEDVRSIEDLQKLPFTYSEDLSGTSYSFLCTSQGDVEKPVTFYTSGSTGTKKRIFFSKADVQKILDFLPRGMNTVVDRDEARVQIFLQNSQGRGTAHILASSLLLYGMKAWISDLCDPVEEILRTTVENKVNVWFGDAVSITRATRLLARQTDLKKLGMQCIFITMTNIPRSMIRYLEETWGCRVSTHYGLTEMGWGMAVDCDVCDGYHYNELDVIVELIDPETGELLPEGETGELVVTSIARDCMPLIRYRSGDICTLSKSVCGSHLAVIGHIQRRREGAYELCGQRFFPSMFDEVLFAEPELLDYRIFAKEDRLFFELELPDPEKFDKAAFVKKLMTVEGMQALREPELCLLPSGALRKFCYEKKRILPISEREI